MGDETDPKSSGLEPLPTARPAEGRPAAALSADDLITLNEEIAGMARAGLPLDQGLAALAREMGRGRLQRVTAQLAADLHAGHPLPEALARQGRRMPPFYAALVAAGIRTGRVSEVLGTLTIYTRALANLRAVVLGALCYPAIIVVVALLLFGFVSFMLLPEYGQFFKEFKLQPPAFTRWLIAFSQHLVLYLVVPLLVVLGMLLTPYLVLHMTEGGRRAWTRLLYRVPLVGTLVRSARLAAFTELLSILVEHALPLPEAFRLAGAASSDPTLADGALQVEQDLVRGLPLGEILRQNHLVPELVVWMTAIGELRGSLGPTLHQVALLYRRQVEMRAAVLQSVLPPVLILISAAIVVGVFVVAVFLPMIQLLEGLSKL